MHALSVTGAAHSLYSLSLDLLTRSDSARLPRRELSCDKCVEVWLWATGL